LQRQRQALKTGGPVLQKSAAEWVRKTAPGGRFIDRRQRGETLLHKSINPLGCVVPISPKLAAPVGMTRHLETPPAIRVVGGGQSFLFPITPGKPACRKVASRQTTLPPPDGLSERHCRKGPLLFGCALCFSSCDNLSAAPAASGVLASAQAAYSSGK
jgi:hypothetical protein